MQGLNSSNVRVIKEFRPVIRLESQVRSVTCVYLREASRTLYDLLRRRFPCRNPRARPPRACSDLLKGKLANLPRAARHRQEVNAPLTAACLHACSPQSTARALFISPCTVEDHALQSSVFANAMVTRQAAIAVGTLEKLPAVIDALIKAVRAASLTSS